MSGRTLLLIGTFVASMAGGGRTATAQDKPTKDQCIDAHETAQLRERDGKLVEARQQFRICSHAACPALVKGECGPGVDRVAARISSVRVDAAPGDVSVDGQPLPAPGADGSIELDPGEHVFRLRTASGTEAEKRITLREGERSTPVTLAPPAPPPAPRPAPAPPAPARISNAVWVLGGVAAIGLGSFVVLAVSGRSQQSDLDECKPNCNQADVDAMKRTYLIGDIALGVAAVAGGAAAYLYFTGESRREREAGAWLSAAPRASGAELRAGVSF